MLKIPLQDQKQKVLKPYQSLGKFLGSKQATIRHINYCIYYCFYYKRSTKLILLCICSISNAALDYMHYFNKKFKLSLNFFIQITFVLRYLHLH